MENKHIKKHMPGAWKIISAWQDTIDSRPVGMKGPNWADLARMLVAALEETLAKNEELQSQLDEEGYLLKAEHLEMPTRKNFTINISFDEN